MDPIVTCFETSTKALQDASSFDDVVAVCFGLDNLNLDLFAKHCAEDTIYTLSESGKRLTNELVKMFRCSKDLVFHLRVMKAIMKPGLCLNYFTVELMLDEYSRNNSMLGAECLRISAWLQNHKYITKCGIGLPDNFQIHQTYVEASLKYSKDTRYFALAIENYIMAYDTKVITKNEPFHFTVLLTNLENAHVNVHKLLLELFKRMVKCYKSDAYYDKDMINDVIELPWTNRNKFSLLANLILVNNELLLQHPKFKMAMFLEGIQVGLTNRHLLSASQSLIKSMQSKDAFKFQLVDTLAQLLWDDFDEQKVKNVLQFWLSPFDPQLMRKLYEALSEGGKLQGIPTTSEKFYRVLLLRNAFKRNFDDSELDERIRDFACAIDELPKKIEIFHILMDQIQSETDDHQRLSNILALLKFLRYNISIKDSGFVELNVMRKLPDLFNLLATRKFRNEVILKEIFGIIRDDLYQHGLDLGCYESITFSLQLLQVILKLYFGASEARPRKANKSEGSLGFGKYLRDDRIWNVTSEINFKQLVKLMQEDDNSDLSDLAMRILTEYFIKTSLVDGMQFDGESFSTWIDEKVTDALKQPAVSSSASAFRHFVLKFEHCVTKCLGVQELLGTINHLKSLFMNLKKSPNPAQSLQEGVHLFKLMDCINYGITRLEPAEVQRNVTPVLNVLNKLIACHFLDFITDPSAPSSFEMIDDKMKTMIGNGDSSLKPKLVVIIWYTIRLSCEISASLATIANSSVDPCDKEFIQVMSSSVDINVQILARCCHKGIIDSASSAIGKITKIISSEFSKLCNKSTIGAKNLHSLLVTLKQELDCGKRPSDDIRSSRGLIVLSHEIIRNHSPFLRFLMEALLIVPEIRSFEDTKSVRFVDNIKPIQLHLLAFLIKDSSLVEDMLKYYNFILLATFKAYKESKEFVEVNALLQVIGAIIPKIGKQNSTASDDDVSMVSYEPKAVTVYEFYVKITYAFRMALYDLDFNYESLSTTYVIILLELLSNFEYRSPGEHWSEIERMPEVFERLMYHECEKVRLMAAKCFANWHKIDEKMIKTIKDDASQLLSLDGNELLAKTCCLRFMIQRYESSVKFVSSFNSEEFRASLRREISKNFQPESISADTFYSRYHLLVFLMFLGFSADHEIIQSLSSEKGLQNNLGYHLWAQKLQALKAK